MLTRWDFILDDDLKAHIMEVSNEYKDRFTQLPTNVIRSKSVGTYTCDIVLFEEVHFAEIPT